MKILLMATHLDPGGIPVYVAGLARGLQALGHTPVVVSSGGWLESRLSQQRIAHHRVPCRTSSELNPKLWLAVFPRLLKIIREEKPDLLHAHTRVMQVLACASSWSTGVPYVTTCHGLYRNRFGRKVLRCWGTTVMAISGATEQRLVAQYRLVPPHRVGRVVNGVDLDFFAQAPDRREVDWFKQTQGLTGDPIIGSIARLSPVKGLDLLLRAVPGLIRDFPRLQVLLVGDGPVREELVRLAYELGVADRVVIAHPVRDTRPALASMQLFAAAALEEGFGLSIVEAMAAGLPVVSSDAGGPAEIIEDGKSGLLVPRSDPEALGAAIRSLLADPALRGRIAESGRARVRERFALKRMVQEVEKIYQRTVNRKP